MNSNNRAARYSSGDWNRAARAERWNKRTAVFGMLAITAIVGWAYVLLMSPLFMVNDIQISGIKTMDPLEVTKETFQVLDSRGGGPDWLKRHIWFINREDLQNQLKDRIFAANVTVDKSWPNVLRLTIEERSKRMIFHSKQQYFWVDLQGVTTAELTADEKHDAQARLLGQHAAQSGDAPIIKHNFDDPIAIGYGVTDMRGAREWLDLADQLTKNGMPYREVEPPDASSTRFNVLSNDGYDVVMDITTPIDLQVQTYLAFKSAKTDLKGVDYVDVRVPGRVTLKAK